MGADLYRDDHDAVRDRHKAALDAAVKRRDAAATDAERDAAQHAVTAAYDAIYAHPYYLRDSYNCWSVFWKIDLSWWQDLKPYLGPAGDGVTEKRRDEDGEEYDDWTLHPPGITKLRADVARRAELLEYNIRDDPEEHKTYFRQKLARFLDFLDQAAAGNHTIRCSV